MARTKRPSHRRPLWNMRLTPARIALLREVETVVQQGCNGQSMNMSAAVELTLRVGVQELTRRLAAGESFF